MTISLDDYNRDPYGALWAKLTGQTMLHLDNGQRAVVIEAVERALQARFTRAAKAGDVRDERRILDELSKLLAGAGLGDGLEIVIRGKKDRGKTTTARLIEKHLAEECDYSDVKVSEDTPPHTDKDAWWDRFARTRARPVRIRVETVK